jgi:16S rRNA processing protein RimM
MDRSNTVLLGKLVKPFGVRGDIRLVLDDRIEALRATPEALLLMEDGRLFPWFVRRWEEHGDGGILVALEDIDSPERARGLCGHDAYVAAGLVDLAEEDPIRSVVGYRLHDQHGQEIGVVEDVLDETGQYLAVVRFRGRRVLLPLAEGTLLDLDEDARTLRVAVAEGLLDL